jgi:O-acetyl-ADP-ribose deacetylase (regulator of RNase III)
MTDVVLVEGDILTSQSQAITNAVNCVGIMGKGVALAFKRKYPEMYVLYAARCARNEVQLGRPYPYFARDGHVIINFPTKAHWRSPSRLGDIERGLAFLRDHLKEWDVGSIALPALGCGSGHLDWSDVAPVMLQYARQFPVPVELYAPIEET